MAEAFYGRAKAYEAALDGDDRRGARSGRRAQRVRRRRAAAGRPAARRLYARGEPAAQPGRTPQSLARGELDFPTRKRCRHEANAKPLESHPATPAWSVPVAVADGPGDRPAARSRGRRAPRGHAIAKAAGLAALPRLEAELRSHAARRRWAARGRPGLGDGGAELRRDARADRERDRRGGRSGVPAAGRCAAPPRRLDLQASKPTSRRKRSRDGAVDLGAIATEFLLLGIDPYPRKPGAVFEAPPAGDPASHPFAALAALKKGDDSKQTPEAVQLGNPAGTAEIAASRCHWCVPRPAGYCRNLTRSLPKDGFPGVPPPAFRSIHASEGPHRARRHGG